MTIILSFDIRLRQTYWCWKLIQFQKTLSHIGYIPKASFNMSQKTCFVILTIFFKINPIFEINSNCD